jgi:hypothetical protein
MKEEENTEINLNSFLPCGFSLHALAPRRCLREQLAEQGQAEPRAE